MVNGVIEGEMKDNRRGRRVSARCVIVEDPQRVAAMAGVVEERTEALLFVVSVETKLSDEI